MGAASLELIAVHDFGNTLDTFEELYLDPRHRASRDLPTPSKNSSPNAEDRPIT